MVHKRLRRSGLVRFSARGSGAIAHPFDGRILAGNPPMPLETLLGRGLAFCCHPCAAWRVLPRSRRLLLVGTYFAAAYLVTLLALLSLVPRAV
jgi:hypothetical protein